MSDVDGLEKALSHLEPNRKGFESDPIGYSSSAWHKWGLALNIAGLDVDISAPPATTDLNSPILWMTHAHALAEAARIILQDSPNLEVLPKNVTGVCDSQYCAVGLMLVAYSLETSLKAMLIIEKGVEVYIEEQFKHRHHRLEELASIVPSLSNKEKAILKALTHFSTWAGKYPDPGSGRIRDAKDVFNLSEKFRITAKDLFELAGKIMKHAQVITNKQ